MSRKPDVYTRRMSGRVRQGLAFGAILWALVAAGAAVRAALAMPADPMAQLEAEFLPLATYLPPRGEVGYLEPFEDAGGDDAIRTYYAAQYALVPRVVMSRVGPEFVIVARDTAKPTGDSRLDGYFLVTRAPSGHSVYRRLAP
ncbi:MAG TPA: hypothetical protein VIY56_01835 [Vicinamibacterales bacterium]